MRLTDCEIGETICNGAKHSMEIPFLSSNISDDGAFDSYMKSDEINGFYATTIINENMVKERFPVTLKVQTNPTVFFEVFKGEVTTLCGYAMDRLYLKVEFKKYTERLNEVLDIIAKNHHYKTKVIMQRERMFGKTILHQLSINMIWE